MTGPIGHVPGGGADGSAPRRMPYDLRFRPGKAQFGRLRAGTTGLPGHRSTEWDGKSTSWISLDRGACAMSLF